MDYDEFWRDFREGHSVTHWCAGCYGRFHGVSGLQCVAVCCSVLQCVAVCCNVMQCVAARCSALQRVAVCCSVLQCIVFFFFVVPVVRLLWLLVSKLRSAVCYTTLQLVAMCCSVLQCAVVFRHTGIQTAMVAFMKSQVCSVLQCVVL